MGKERVLKANSYLTDGKSIIKIGSVSKPDWSPMNNYGKKRHEYFFCSTYPINLFIDGIKVIQCEYLYSIPSLWFQEGYHLNNFKPISKKLIYEKILKTLNQ